MITEEAQEKVFLAQCLISVARLAICGIADKQNTGEEFSEFEQVGLKNLLRDAMESMDIFTK